MPTNTPQFYVPTNVVFRIVTATSIEILNFIGVFLPIGALHIVANPILQLKFPEFIKKTLVGT